MLGDEKGTIRGQVIDSPEHGTDPINVEVSHELSGFSRQLRADPVGSFVLQDIPVGGYRIRVLCGDLSAEAICEVKPGSGTLIELRLGKGDSHGPVSVFYEDVNLDEWNAELDLLRALEVLPRYPSEDQVKDFCNRVVDEYIRPFVLPKGTDARITLRVKQQDESGRSSLIAKYVVPHMATSQYLAYPNSIAGLSLALGQIIKYPDDAEKEVDFRRLSFFGKLPTLVELLKRNFKDEATIEAIKEKVRQRTLKIRDLYQLDSGDTTQRNGTFVVLPIPWVGSELGEVHTKAHEIGVLILHSEDESDPFTPDCISKLKNAGDFFRLALDRYNSQGQIEERRKNFEHALTIFLGTRSGNPVTKYVDSCEEWINEKALVFASFVGSMHLRFGENDLRSFLLQFETEREVELIKRCIDAIAQNYWNTGRVEEAFVTRLWREIDHYAGNLRVVYPYFGHPQDSSAMLLAGPLKGLPLDVKTLESFLSQSADGQADCSPDGRVICFVDDNFATGTQAPAIFSQYFGYSTPEEEFHVKPLEPRLQREFRKFKILFATIYASVEGVKRLRERKEQLGLNLEILFPLHPIEETSWTNLSTEPRELAEFRALFEKYGVPLLNDKVGRRWDTTRRRQWSLGYGGQGNLFLFSYQTPTSLPVLFWRYGKIRTGFWKPLFWRESDYERFIKRLYVQNEHQRNPEALWGFYMDCVSVRREFTKEGYPDLTLDETNTFYDDVKPAVVQQRMEITAVGRHGQKQFWHYQLEDFYAGRKGLKSKSSSSVDTKRVDPSLTHDVIRSLLDWKAPLTEKLRHNIEATYSAFKPREGIKGDACIPRRDAEPFLKNHHKEFRTRRLTREKVVSAYKAWKTRQ